MSHILSKWFLSYHISRSWQKKKSNKVFKNLVVKNSSFSLSLYFTWRRRDRVGLWLVKWAVGRWLSSGASLLCYWSLSRNCLQFFSKDFREFWGKRKKISGVKRNKWWKWGNFCLLKRGKKFFFPHQKYHFHFSPEIKENSSFPTIYSSLFQKIFPFFSLYFDRAYKDITKIALD